MTNTIEEAVKELKKIMGDKYYEGAGTDFTAENIIDLFRNKAVEEIESVKKRKNEIIESMMDEIKYLRSSQPARKKPVVRIKSGDAWYVPMITQAIDSPDGFYIEAELEAIAHKE